MVSARLPNRRLSYPGGPNLGYEFVEGLGNAISLDDGLGETIYVDDADKPEAEIVA
jgi:hypothetical protein